MLKNLEDVVKEKKELERRLLIACDSLYFGAADHYKLASGKRFAADLVNISSVKATMRDDFVYMLKDMTLQARPWSKEEQLAAVERLRRRAGQEVVSKGWSPVYPWLENEPYFGFFLAIMEKDPVYQEKGEGIKFSAGKDFTLEDVKPIATDIATAYLQQRNEKPGGVDGLRLDLEAQNRKVAELEEELERFEKKFGKGVKKEDLKNLGKEMDEKTKELTKELNKLVSYTEGYSSTKELLKGSDEIGKRKK